MGRRLAGATFVAAGVLFLAAASSAQPHQGCVYVWSPVASQICSPSSPCGWCGAGEIWWQPVAEAYLCSTGAGGAAATSCFQGTRWSNIQAWVATWKPTGAAGCENPVSAVYDDCYTPPNPDQCCSAVRCPETLSSLWTYQPEPLLTGSMVHCSRC